MKVGIVWVRIKYLNCNHFVYKKYIATDLDKYVRFPIPCLPSGMYILLQGICPGKLWKKLKLGGSQITSEAVELWVPGASHFSFN